MLLGGAAAAAMIALAIVVIVASLRGSSATDAIAMVTRITLPSGLLGLALVALGRWVYGDWHDAAPVRQASSITVRFAGFLIAIGLGAMLLFLVATGIAPDDQAAAIVLGAGTALGVVLVMLGLRMKPPGRRYLDD